VSVPLEKLCQIVKTCKACSLHKGRKNAVFDCGKSISPLMIVGEAPGEEEDRTGLAFTGKAGKHMKRLLRAARVPDDSYYCTHVIKCRPEKDRFPDGKEATTCRNFLDDQVKLIKPKAVIVCGKEALKYLLLWKTHEEPEPFHPWINRMFRRRDLYGEIIFLVCYHPGYLMKAKIEEDEEAWVQAVAQLWTYCEHKRAGTPPAPVSFEEIRSAPKVPRMGRNLFGKDRGRIL